MFYVLARFVLRPLFLALCRPHITGRENVPLDRPVILASNHLSFIDSIAIPLAAPRRVAYLAKAEYFTGRGIGGWLTRTLFTALGAHPVERETHRAAQAALDTALGILREGTAFGLYPEGTRSRDGRLARGKTGVAWLALTADCPVVPVAVRGTDRVQPVGARWPRPHRIAITFGEPLTFPEHRGQADRNRARREVTDRIMLAIADLSGQEKAGWDVPREAV
ncbi:1-acyl-sn-glycerol-3-phosphate acyltransferase [Blastococcus sp. MG754426]|uniref:lysophospholipid acyltransferase family protein n=1 Tax=unclassified Blastococcus TaxID=2619396 RepID=UPI001EF0F22F|nr:MULTISPECIES: lysophospholipid acyltransferase family protein [unclassified Blastococcus]MCF6510108.1 1-acyl-sn-glycerol-3-phosphate acyltransferase [Blastococcus sp. MG754426]MCF6514389.1 1-acyl-sn-glycerol-3-phosphate acyltransferase [Blastococcus sp. MG754427]MCF6737599.1 1-acyl-sn-glycerol-3-phosphate acyltransferase [Blastococcus sp. KM273129]